MTGKIESIVEKTSRTGKSYFRVKVSGEWYTAWKNTMTGIKEGDYVNFTVDDGLIKSIEKTKPEAAPAAGVDKSVAVILPLQALGALISGMLAAAGNKKPTTTAQEILAFWGLEYDPFEDDEVPDEAEDED